METRLSILFYAKKTKTTKKIRSKELTIYLRATIEGHRFEVTTNRNVDLEKWSSAAGKMKGNSETSRSVNHHLDTIKQRDPNIMEWSE